MSEQRAAIKRKRLTVKQRLSILAEALYNGVLELTPRQRTSAIGILDNLTDENSTWILYRLKEPLRGLIDDASSAKERIGRMTAARRKREKGIW